MKTLLVLIHDDPGQEARLQAALDLARALKARLICLEVSLPPFETGDHATLAGVAFVPEERPAKAVASRHRIEGRLDAEGVSFDWVQGSGYISATICEYAEAADLIVLSGYVRDTLPDMQEIAAEVLLGARRPVMAVPPGCKRLDAYGNAIVAWDGSAESEAALRAALPLLALASATTLVECSDGSTKAPAEEAAAWLSRHGVKATVRRIPARFDIPSTILLEQVEALDAAYVVMGGFGHSRLAEAILGGVSRRMLHESPVPLLLTH